MSWTPYADQASGGFAATVDNARRYNQAAIDHVRRGTPKEARGAAGDVRVRRVQREAEAGGADGEKLWALPSKHVVSRVSHQIPVKVSSCRARMIMLACQPSAHLDQCKMMHKLLNDEDLKEKKQFQLRN